MDLAKQHYLEALMVLKLQWRRNYFDNKKVIIKIISEVQKKTGMIFQEFNLVNNLSAINNVLTGLLNSSNKFLITFLFIFKRTKIEALRSLETVGLLEKSIVDQMNYLEVKDKE